MRKIRIGSLCTGYGGLEMAIQEVFGGGKVCFTADNDPAVSEILSCRYPSAPNLGDLTKIDGRDLPGVNVLAAGFPCQPLSTMGHERGIDDERWLFDEITRIVGEMESRPGLLVFENVPALRTNRGGEAFRRVIHGLSCLGYVGRYRPVRASETGAPHRRIRIFIVAQERGTEERAAAIRDSALVVTDATSVRTGGPYTVPDTGESCWDARELFIGRGVHPSHDGFWGDYGSAIWRWEAVLGRTAPFPLQPGETGRQPKLSARFVEWMMGLPEGWVTDVPGLSWNDQIHALGNGVVPQQAALALRLLLE